MDPPAHDVAGPKAVGGKRLLGLHHQRCKLSALVIARGAWRDLEKDFYGASALDSPGAHSGYGIGYGS